MLVQIVVPCKNESLTIDYLVDNLRRVCDEVEASNKVTTKILFVDDGSDDNTWRKICDLASFEKRVTGIRLTRNFGQQAAIACGYDASIGEAVITIDADLQDPPEVIAKLIEKWQEGAHIVIAVREDRKSDSFMKRWTAFAFYRVFHALSGGFMVADAGDYRLVSHQVVTALRGLKEHRRFLRGFVGWLGYSPTTIRYTRAERVGGKSNYNYLRMFRFAMFGIASFSSIPLGIALISLPLLLITTFVMTTLYFQQISPSKWVEILFPSGLVIVYVLSVACSLVCWLYLRLILDEVRQRPEYVIWERIPKE